MLKERREKQEKMDLVNHGLRFARMLGIRNMREQCFLTAAIQNIKRMVSSFFLVLFCFSLQQNLAFAV